MIQKASFFCLSCILFFGTSCTTTKSTTNMAGASNPPMHYTYNPSYASGYSPPQVTYTDAEKDADNIPNRENRNARLVPEINLPARQQQIELQQLIVIDNATLF